MIKKRLDNDSDWVMFIKENEMKEYYLIPTDENDPLQYPCVVCLNIIDRSNCNKCGDAYYIFVYTI